MFGKSFRLFRLFGFDVKADMSWFIIVALIAWSLANGPFKGFSQAYEPGNAVGLAWTMGFAAALGLFVSVVLHEFGHSIVARRLGLPMEGITLFLFGGVAEMSGEPATPRVEFLMAIAGPIVSVAVGGICYLAARVMPPGPVQVVVHWLGFINLILAAFNLVPAFPLDGGRVMRSALWAWKGNLSWATRITAGMGRGFGMLLIFMGVFSAITGDLGNGIWWFILGLFLYGAAKSSYRSLMFRQAMAGEHVRRFMKSDVQSVPPDLTLDHLVKDYIYRYHYKMFPVIKDGSLLGCVTTKEINGVPQERWQMETVGQITSPCSSQNTISSDADVIDALTTMTRNGRSRLLVVDSGRLVGIVALKDLMALLSLKLELHDVRKA